MKHLSHRQLLILTIVALVVRFFCLGADMKIWVDSQAYLQCVQALLSGHWSDFYVERTPGFPLFLLIHQELIRLVHGQIRPELIANAAGLTQAFLGTFTAVMTADIAARLFRKPWLGFWSGLVVALSPNLILAEHWLLTESLYGFSLMLCLWAWVRWPIKNGRLLLLGLLSGWLIWVRPTGLLLAPIVGYCLWRKKADWKPLAWYLAPVACFCLFWMGFQWQVHHYAGMAAGGGQNQLYKAVNFVDYDTPSEPEFKAALRQQSMLYPEEGRYEAVNDTFMLHYMAEKQAPQPRAWWQVYLDSDASARRIALEAISRHPLQYLWVTAQQAYVLLTEPTDWDPALLYWLPLLLLSVTGQILMWQKRGYRGTGRLLLLVLWAHLLAYPLLTVCTARYRIPLEPLFIIPAVYAAARMSLLIANSRPVPAE